MHPLALRSTKAALATVLAAIAGLAAAAPQLQCEQGPLTRNYGGSEWHVYACNDQRSLVVTVIKSTPKLPFFYFFVTPASDGVQVAGEGNGDRSITASAYNELSRLTPAQVASLVSEARSVGRRE
jgi:hypothetical protein